MTDIVERLLKGAPHREAEAKAEILSLRTRIAELETTVVELQHAHEQALNLHATAIAMVDQRTADLYTANSALARARASGAESELRDLQQVFATNAEDAQLEVRHATTKAEKDMQRIRASCYGRAADVIQERLNRRFHFSTLAQQPRQETEHG